jgi:hypothetical protein
MRGRARRTRLKKSPSSERGGAGRDLSMPTGPYYTCCDKLLRSTFQYPPCSRPHNPAYHANNSTTAHTLSLPLSLSLWGASAGKIQLSLCHLQTPFPSARRHSSLGRQLSTTRWHRVVQGKYRRPSPDLFTGSPFPFCSHYPRPFSA